jgi:hypothetical protein
MTDAERHQEELEQMEYEETTAYLKYQHGYEIKVHIWADDETIFVNFSNYPVSFSLHLEKRGAEKVIELLTNALRRAK